MNLSHILSFSDGAALWADKLGQHLLHERHSAVFALCARAEDCSQKVSVSAIFTSQQYIYKMETVRFF